MKRKLKRWVKVVITVILIIVSVLIYTKLGSLGELAQINKGYQFLCIGAWAWLLLGQLMSYSLIWGK